MAKKKAKKRIANDSVIENQLKSVTTELKDGVFIFTAPMSISDFSDKINQPSSAIVGHFFKQGKMYNINHTLDEEQIAELCLEYGFDFQKETEVNAQNFMDHIEISDDEQNLTERPPIITVMGHVDHGKTTLIDNIRNASVAAGEAGGITQHTGAYQVLHDEKKITFLDTPGHEAFTAMRARGAKVTDIVVLVVAADDGVKPQTKEAIDHSKAAGVPMIVFVNKMDKEGADPERVKSELSGEDVLAEDWGGDYQFIYGSGLTGAGISELFDAINIQAEMLELKANDKRYPIGTVVESRIDKGRGTVATVIVENGTLYSRDFIVAGSNYGRIRTMTDAQENKMESAGPGTPVVVTGLNYTPQAGDKFFGFSDEKFAKKLADEKAQRDKAEELRERTAIQVEDGVKVFKIIIKADVQGTAEAVKHSLAKLENEEAKAIVVRSSVGAINKSDVLLAQASNATIFGFNINPTPEIRALAEESKVEIESYKIIYKMIEKVESILTGMQAPKYEEQITGRALVQQMFFFSKVGNIAGSVMESGYIEHDSLVRVIRNGKVVHEGQIATLQRETNQAKKVDNGKDFGTTIKKYDKVQVDDVLELYKMVEVKL